MGTLPDQSLSLRPEELSNAKRLLLEKRLRGNLQLVKKEERIQPRPFGAVVPISAEQYRIWLHAETNPELPLYNEAITIHRRGSFDLAALESAFNEVLRRHEAWRTSFMMQAGELIQVIHENVTLHLPLVDLSELPAAQREDEALRIAALDAATPIPLDRAPLLRARVLRMAEDEHRLYITLHHIIFDGVSIYRILMPELTALYAAFAEGRPSPLAEPQLQYGDYAIWRAAHLASPAVAHHLDYWKQQLAGKLPVLNLPADRPRPMRPTHRGSMECFQLAPELIAKLRAWSQEHGVTLYMTLLAAYKALLFRYSGQNDLIVGGAADARRRPELEGTMGYFLDTVPIRTRPAADRRFSDYVLEVRDSVLGALGAADVPFDHIVQAVEPERNSSHHPVFQAFFSIEPPAPQFAEGWDLTQMDVTVRSAKFDLYLELDERPEAMVARIMYNAEIFEAPTIRRMAAHWQVILNALPALGDAALGTLPLLTPRELADLKGAGGWNDTARSFPQMPLHEVIAQQANAAPDAEAVVFHDQRWTYRQLMDRAGRISADLGEAGVTRGAVVAVLLPRSADLIATLVAIHRAGAAYLPLDPEAPVARLAACLADAGPVALITDRSAAELPATGARILFIDELGVGPAADAPPAPAVRLEDLAYVIYTSGTTGKPKGVEISHASIVNLLASFQAEPGFTAQDRLLAVTTVAFDIAALELFLPLISGGAVIVAPRAVALDPYLLAAEIERSQCTVMQATPATWLALLSTGWRGPGRPMKVLCGGEPLPRELAERLLALGLELWNVYGPTETTVWSTLHRITHSAGPISIGKPIANTTAYILDEQKQMLPANVPGRLYLGGAGLARGYRGQPEATAARFAFIAAAGERLYDTGDLAVRRADGTLECLGRADNQVKVRGYRVELEAIETAVRKHPAVSAAAARVWPDAAGSTRLSVYVVGKEGPPPDAAELRQFLRLDLPEYMIPSDVIAVDALPLSLNGKVDRSLLAPPEPREAVASAPEPMTEFESRLAALWRKVLHVEAVARHDSFFDLGGHSLLVATLQQSIETAFGHRLSMANLFHAPTLAQQASLLEAAAQAEPVRMIPLQPRGERPPLFWLHPPAHIVHLTEALGSEQPVMGVGLSENDVQELGEAATMEAIAARHVRTILHAQPQGPYYLGGLCTGGIVAFEVAAQLRTAGHEVALLLLLDAQNPVFYKKVGSLPVEWSKACFYVRQAFQDARPLHQTTLRQRLMRLMRRVSQIWPPSVVPTETVLGERMTDSAAYRYQPPRYDGNVLLLQPKDRPRLVDHAPGWQTVVAGRFVAMEVNGHHDELLSRENVPSLARVISFFLGEDGDPHLSQQTGASPATLADSPVLTPSEMPL